MLPTVMLFSVAPVLFLSLGHPKGCLGCFWKDFVEKAAPMAASGTGKKVLYLLHPWDSCLWAAYVVCRGEGFRGLRWTVWVRARLGEGVLREATEPRPHSWPSTHSGAYFPAYTASPTNVLIFANSNDTFCLSPPIIMFFNPHPRIYVFYWF